MIRSERLIDNGRGLHVAIPRAAELGYAFAPNVISELGCRLLVEEAESLALQLDDRVDNPINAGSGREVSQKHEQYYAPLGDPSIPHASFLGRTIAKRVKARRFRPGLEGLSRWLPNEVGYQLYRDDTHHLGKHKDRLDDEMLGATITLSGSAWVGIYDTIGRPDDYKKTREIDAFDAQPGDMMLLRATGLGSGDRMIHEVSPPENAPRLIVNFRMRPNVLPAPNGEAA